MVDKPPVIETEHPTTEVVRSSLFMRILAGALLLLSAPLIAAIACAAWLGQPDASLPPSSGLSAQESMTVFAWFAVPYLCLASWFAARELLPRRNRPTSLAVKLAAASLLMMVVLVFVVALLGWVIQVFFPRAYLDPDETPLRATLAELRMLLHPLLAGTLALRALLPFKPKGQLEAPIRTRESPGLPP
jgi:cation transporter-like permease